MNGGDYDRINTVFTTRLNAIQRAFEERFVSAPGSSVLSDVPTMQYQPYRSAAIVNRELDEEEAFNRGIRDRPRETQGRKRSSACVYPLKQTIGRTECDTTRPEEPPRKLPKRSPSGKGKEILRKGRRLYKRTTVHSSDEEGSNDMDDSEEYSSRDGGSEGSDGDIGEGWGSDRERPDDALLCHSELTLSVDPTEDALYRETDRRIRAALQLEEEEEDTTPFWGYEHGENDVGCEPNTDSPIHAPLGQVRRATSGSWGDYLGRHDFQALARRSTDSTAGYCDGQSGPCSLSRSYDPVWDSSDNYDEQGTVGGHQYGEPCNHQKSTRG